MNLVWQRDEVQDEVVGQLALFQFRRFRKTAPDFRKIGSESLFEALQRCGANMVPDDE